MVCRQYVGTSVTKHRPARHIKMGHAYAAYLIYVCPFFFGLFLMHAIGQYQGTYTRYGIPNTWVNLFAKGQWHA
jgi:hypothetical protein